jgi:tetratricopeptide (TPR) repeat protein
MISKRSPFFMAASHAGSRSTARGKPWAVLAAALLLAGACSRAPEPPADGAREGGGSTPPPPLAAADAHLARGEEASERRENARAKEELEQARALFAKDQDWEGYVRAQNGIGAVVRRQGDYKAALEHLNVALATAREKLAPGHPEVARSHKEMGSVYVETGRPTEGLELLRKALEMRRAAGDEPHEVAEILQRMSVAHANQGDDEQALAVLEEAEALQRATLGARDPRLADTLIGKGTAYWPGPIRSGHRGPRGGGRHPEAEGGAQSSLAIATSTSAASTGARATTTSARVYYEKALPPGGGSARLARTWVSFISTSLSSTWRWRTTKLIASAERAS